MQKEIVRKETIKQREKNAPNEGVRIGMTTEQVLISNWGKPKKINRSTHSFGTREQWVYGNGHYLYFEDGILTSVTTSN